MPILPANVDMTCMCIHVCACVSVRDCVCVCLHFRRFFAAFSLPFIALHCPSLTCH